MNNSLNKCQPGEVFPFGLVGLIFDVDGVLFDSRNSNVAYYNCIREAVGLGPITAEEEDYCHMASVQQALERIIPEPLLGAASLASQNMNYQEQILPMLSPEPGLLETLHWFKQWGVKAAVCTNRTQSVEGLLHYFGLERFFFPVQTAGNGPAKPDPGGLLAILAAWGVAPCHVAFIGDSKVDQQAADAGGVPFWSFRNRALTAQIHFDSFFELITWITPLVERK